MSVQSADHEGSTNDVHRSRDFPVLVTGATGNVGAPIVRALLEAGIAVRGAASSTAAVRKMFGDSVDAVELDFTDRRTWSAAFHGVNQMFLMRPPQLSRPRKQMVPALEAARAAGVRQMVFLSLQGAEANRIVPHAALETWLRGSGAQWTFVRPSFFMQNLSTTHASDIRDRDTIVVPAGDGATAFVDADDVAAVAAAALLDPASHEYRAWTVTGSEALSYFEVASIIGETIGRTITYTKPGISTYAWHAKQVLEMPPAMIAVTTAIYTTARLGKAGGLTDHFAAVTGHEPTTFAAFAAREHQAWER
ncbi:MAG: NmrA family NAD(P)-binding protein [Actinomycetes bacterium]